MGKCSYPLCYFPQSRIGWALVTYIYCFLSKFYSIQESYFLSFYLSIYHLAIWKKKEAYFLIKESVSISIRYMFSSIRQKNILSFGWAQRPAIFGLKTTGTIYKDYFFLWGRKTITGKSQILFRGLSYMSPRYEGCLWWLWFTKYKYALILSLLFNICERMLSTVSGSYYFYSGLEY